MPRTSPSSSSSIRDADRLRRAILDAGADHEPLGAATTLRDALAKRELGAAARRGSSRP